MLTTYEDYEERQESGQESHEGVADQVLVGLLNEDETQGVARGKMGVPRGVWEGKGDGGWG